MHKFAQVFQATVSVLHSFHHLHGVYMDIGRDFARALTVVFQCTVVLTCVIACTLQTLLQMLLLAATHANTSFKALLDGLHLFSDALMDSRVSAAWN